MHFQGLAAWTGPHVACDIQDAFHSPQKKQRHRHSQFLSRKLRGDCKGILSAVLFVWGITTTTMWLIPSFLLIHNTKQWWVRHSRTGLNLVLLSITHNLNAAAFVRHVGATGCRFLQGWEIFVCSSKCAISCVSVCAHLCVCIYIHTNPQHQTKTASRTRPVNLCQHTAQSMLFDFSCTSAWLCYGNVRYH